MNYDHQDARMILALAAETDDEFIWDHIKTLQPEMFAAGPVQIKFAYFGREGALQTRPCITTKWVTDADDMADIMDRGRRGCVCGCYIEIGDILEQALQETRQRPVQAVVIVGDYFRVTLLKQEQSGSRHAQLLGGSNRGVESRKPSRRGNNRAGSRPPDCFRQLLARVCLCWRLYIGSTCCAHCAWGKCIRANSLTT
jgi:hypothetical protein